jgi:hypothetical protein
VGFADAYLQKAALREPLISSEPHPQLTIAVTIPVYNESGLERCLDSLFRRTLPGELRAEVLILVNAPASAPREVLEQNQKTFYEARNWIRGHHHPSIDFHLLIDQTFAKKDAGVGTARKILMDEAVRRFNRVGNPVGILASMDADAVVEPNYLEALLEHFGSGNSPVEGCSISFAHPLSVEEAIQSGLMDATTALEELTPGIIDAVIQYELHLRYYVQAVRSTGFPNAFHTVGSAFAVRADAYCMEGGMSRRQGGEDFYFIQKVSQRGYYSDCTTTRVIPSPRPSDRVPFGTGPVVRRLLKEGGKLNTYDPRLFTILGDFINGLEGVYSEDPEKRETWMRSLNPLLLQFLNSQEFESGLQEILANSASYPAFRKRFWRWFNMFRIMKFLHFAREHGYPDIPVGKAATELLLQIRPEMIDPSEAENNLRYLLELYRKLDRPQA